MQALLPCWRLLSCGEQTCKDCPAYMDETQPCWTIKGLICAPRGDECRECVVYRFGSLCTEDIKCLLHDQSDVQKTCAAMKELMQRKRHSTEKES
jgi:hypothetical protein